MGKNKAAILVTLGHLLGFGITSLWGQSQILTTSPPLFDPGYRLQAAGSDLNVGNYVSVPCASLARNTGPIKLDWTEDGKKDLLVGTFHHGNVYYFQNTGLNNIPGFPAGVKLQADGHGISVPYG